MRPRATGPVEAAMHAMWPNVKLRRLDEAPARVAFGEGVTIAVGATLNGLTADEVTVELVLDRDGHDHVGASAIPLVAAGTDSDTTRFELRLVPEHAGGCGGESAHTRASAARAPVRARADAVGLRP